MANTGNKIFTKLLKVTDDINQYPLDINDELCSVTLLPQAEKSNTLGQPDYIAPFQDLTACPLSETPINCVLSEWSAWSTCSGNQKTRTRTIITEGSGGGTTCNPLDLTETISCGEIPKWIGSTPYCEQ